MALQQNEDFNGITCNYWKITNLDVHYVSGKTAAVLGLYKDADTRTEDVGNIVRKVTVMQEGLYESRAEMYPKCIASGMYFEGAENV